MGSQEPSWLIAGAGKIAEQIAALPSNACPSMRPIVQHGASRHTRLDKLLPHILSNSGLFAAYTRNGHQLFDHPQCIGFRKMSKHVRCI
jgi:hypothetical protein